MKKCEKVLAMGSESALKRASEFPLGEKRGKAHRDERLSCARDLLESLPLAEGDPVERLQGLSLALPVIAELMSDKDREVSEVSVECFRGLCEGSVHTSGRDVLVLCPSVVGCLQGGLKPATVMECISCLCSWLRRFPDAMKSQYPSLVPPLVAAAQDPREAVRAEACKALEAVCGGCDNLDLQKALPSLLEFMKHSAQGCEEPIHLLAATTFVQVVETSALALISPLLLRGFKDPKTAVKRQCAVIVENMSKLVLEPRDATPFLDQLIPCVERCSRDLSDPEARERCENALGHLQRIQRDARAAGERVPKAVSDTESGVVVDVARGLLEAKVHGEDAWKECLEGLTESPERAVAVAAECLRGTSASGGGRESSKELAAEKLCECTFTLAYGSKILLHNTGMRLHRGFRYGLLGGNDSGKTTLLRAIANGQVEGFPPRDEVRTVFVESDIQGELSDLNVVDYVLADERIREDGVTRDQVRAMLASVGFTERMLDGGVSHLSGGWRMKLALSRAMLQKADILLCDEPSNHLDVINVQWLKDYLNSLQDVTSIIVSHDTGILNDVCTHMMQIQHLKLLQEEGNLASFLVHHPDALSHLSGTTGGKKSKFTFPAPGMLENVKSKGKPLMKMDRCTFTYPGNSTPTLSGATVRVSLASRVACVGVNGAGKSTLIKILTGQLVPQEGEVWTHPSARIAYVAQHAFAHIEQHLQKTPNEYIRWRYEGGQDKESLQKASMALTEEEEEMIRRPVEITMETESGTSVKTKRVISGLTGARRTLKKAHEYEIRFQGMSHDSNLFYPGEKLALLGWAKHIKQVDDRIALAAGQYVKPLTKENVERHLEGCGLEKEFASHYRISALSGGQKVKVVLAACTWGAPHIIILDEPTNYLDKESLECLSGAIEEFEGGVVIISHSNDFISKLCPETWVVENGVCDVKGDPEWMAQAMNRPVGGASLLAGQEEECVDALGNVTKVKKNNSQKKLSRKELKAKAKIRKAKLERGEEVSSEDDD